MTVYTESFELADETALTNSNTWYASLSGTWVADTARFVAGAASARSDKAASASSTCFYTVSGTPSAVAWRGYFYFTAANSGGDANLIKFVDTANTTVNCYWISTSKIRLADDGGVVWTSTNNMPLDQWVRIELYATIGTSGATLEFAYYLGNSDTPVESYSSNVRNTGAAITQWQAGLSTSAYATDYWMDALAFDDAATALLGPVSTGVTFTTGVAVDTHKAASAPFTASTGATVTGVMAQWEFDGDLTPEVLGVSGLTPGDATFGADVREDTNFSPLDWDGDLQQPWIGQAQPGVIAVTAESGKAGTTSSTYTTRNVYIDLPVTVAAGHRLQIDDVVVRATRGHWQAPMGVAVRTSVDAYAAEVTQAEVTSNPQVMTDWILSSKGFVSGAEDETVTVRLYVWTPFYTSALVIDRIDLVGVVTSDAEVPIEPPTGITLRVDGIQELPVEAFARIAGVETPVDVFARVGGVEKLVLAAPRTDPAFTLTATPTDTQVTVEWPNVATADGGYFVGRDGFDANGTGAWSTTVAQGNTSQVFANLRSLTTYRFTVRALASGGATIHEATVDATTTGTQPDPPDPPEPPGTLYPGATALYQGDSGHPWNACLSGSWGVGKRQAWEAWLGRRADGMELFPGRSTTTTMEWIPAELVAMRGYKVITLPCQPQGPNKDQDNTAGAAGVYNAWWRSYGTKLASLGMNNNRTIIRMNHEPNPSSYAWHPWHWGAGGPTLGVQRFRQSFINAAYNVRETAPDILITINHARGNFDTAYTGGLTWGQCVDPLMTAKDRRGRYLVDGVTQDSYDNSPGVTPLGVDPGEAQRLANWYQQTNGVNSATPPGRAQNFGIPTRGTCYAYCEHWTAQRGEPVWFWHHEWGLSHRTDSRGGQDDKFYIELMWNWYQERAVMNGGLMLGESYFNHPGGPSTNRHEVFDYTTGQIPPWNAKAGAKFKQLWGA